MSGLVHKLVIIRQNLKWTEKRGRNTHQNYDYVMAADIAADMGKKLAEAGIVITRENLKVSYEQIPNVDPKKSAATEARIEVTYVLRDVESNETLRYESAGAGRDNGDKAIYKAWTGCFKYFFIQAFAMPIGEDPENDNDDDRRTPPTADPLSDEQCQEIVRLIAMSKSETKKILDYYKVNAIKDLPYEEVRAALGKKMRKRPIGTILDEAKDYPAVPPEAEPSTNANTSPRA